MARPAEIPAVSTPASVPPRAPIETEAAKSSVIAPAHRIAAGPAIKKAVWPVIKVLEEDMRGCTWIERQGAAQQEEQESVYQMRAVTIARARSEAIEGYLHIQALAHAGAYRSELLSGRKDLVGQILEITTPARILDEAISQEGYRQVADCPDCSYRVNLEACVAHLPSRSDRDFSVRLRLDRDRLSSGQRLGFSVTSNRSAYLYLYLVGGDWTTKLLFPAGDERPVKLKAGEVWRSAGLVVNLPKGQDMDIGSIRVIASKTPLARDLDDPAFGGYLSLARRLNSSSLDWREDADAFLVSRP